MAQGIFLIHDDGSLVEMREREYATEALLQQLLANYPRLLGGEEWNASAPRRWLLVRREAAIPDTERGKSRWAVDHVFLDQDAVPTLVEVKRSSDTRLRREVVGQMLDYAANAVVYWPVETLRTAFEERCRSEGRDAEAALVEFLEEAGDPATFWQQAKTNLQAGRVRMLFVADEIPAELRRIVEFLNQQMDPAEVLALEIRQFVGEGVRTLVPAVIGQTAEAIQRKAAVVPRTWDEASFMAALEARKGPLAVAAAGRLLTWARERATRVWFGNGQRTGSFVPVIRHDGDDHFIFAAYTFGNVEIGLQYLKTRDPFASEERRRDLVARLNAIPGVEIPPDELSKRPGIPLELLAQGDRCEVFCGVFDWVIAEIHSSRG